MIPSLAPKGRRQGQCLLCHTDESWRPGWPGCWDGTKQLFLIAVHSSINYCYQVPKHLSKVLFWLPCQQLNLSSHGWEAWALECPARIPSCGSQGTAQSAGPRKEIALLWGT